MTYLLHSVIFSIITIHMLKTGKILPENIQDARKGKINCSSAAAPAQTHTNPLTESVQRCSVAAEQLVAAEQMPKERKNMRRYKVIPPVFHYCIYYYTFIYT